MPISALGATIGLLFSIFLIFRKVQPVYALFVGAILGGLLGGAELSETIKCMIEGGKAMIPAVLRILAAGILAGVLIETGAAAKIAQSIIEKTGKDKALYALILATFILTAVGVFIDVAVITVAPIALATASQSNISKSSILLAMIGGGKSGNIISPNPNTIAAAETFKIDLSALMMAGFLPAIVGLVVTSFIAYYLISKKETIFENAPLMANSSLPSFISSISGPTTTIILLSLRPIFGVKIDPIVALPLGGIIGAICMGKAKFLNEYSISGLSKMSGVAILLIGTGVIAGIISNSTLKDLVTDFITYSGLPPIMLASFSGILMSAATASTTSGTAVASGVFGETILSYGTSPLAAAAMIHSGATVLDHLPHGSFFHATGGSVFMDIKQRFAIVPYETFVGLALCLSSLLIYGFF
jgi:GntP family gluconate:H+ symporter